MDLIIIESEILLEKIYLGLSTSAEHQVSSQILWLKDGFPNCCVPLQIASVERNGDSRSVELASQAPAAAQASRDIKRWTTSKRRAGWQLSQPAGKQGHGTINVVIMKAHKAEGEHALQSCVENRWHINMTIIAL